MGNAVRHRAFTPCCEAQTVPARSMPARPVTVRSGPVEGMEVIYTGLHQTPEQIVETAIQEDADVVGLSVLSGAHMTLFRRVVELLRERGAEDIVVFGGGIIPEADIPELTALGVAKVFTPGASTQSIVEWVRANVGRPAETT